MRKVIQTCPFIKLGKFLTDQEADKAAPANDNIYSNYEPAKAPGRGSSLGKGAFGEVILMKEKKSGKLVAMKIIDKKIVPNSNDLKSLLNEINIQKRIIHENIIKLLAHIENDKHIYIVMEYANRGSLFQLIRKKKKLTEKEAFFFFTQTGS